MSGPAPAVRKYPTFYRSLTEMVGWLVDQGVTHVAMEATGIYWRPVFHALREAARPLEVLLVNARHVKNVPGRKSDLLTELPGPAAPGRCVAGPGWLGSRVVINDGGMQRELAELVVPQAGSLEATGDLFVPYRLVDGGGVAVGPVTAFFAELAACGRPGTTQRSYGMDLLRWFRFLWAVGLEWDQATRVEARDFCRWLQATRKPTRPHGAIRAAALPERASSRPPRG